MRNRLRHALLGLAVACAGMAAWTVAAGGQAPPAPAPGAGQAVRRLAEQGRALYADTCVACHGEDLRGRSGLGPSLRGSGAAATDFYLSTGRMPLADPTDEPLRTEPQFSRAEIEALVAYVGSFGGPPVPPAADPRLGDVARGKELFTEHCAGCHQVVARGGIVTGSQVPDISEIPPGQVAEAVRVGPFLMPRFDEAQLPSERLDDIAAYLALTRDPVDRGGWGIGNIGPIPEGLATWLLAMLVLLGVTRLIGERAR